MSFIVRCQLRSFWGEKPMRTLALACAVAFAACDTTNETKIIIADLSGSVPGDASTINPLACTPNAKECVTSSLARVCPADGTQWLAVQCAPGQKCAAGDCVVDQSLCVPGEGACTDAKHGLRCMANGMGFAAVDCTTFAGTVCSGAGICQGACAVGSSVCADLTHVATCSDGAHQTVGAACDAGKLCVDTTTTADFPT